MSTESKSPPGLPPSTERHGRDLQKVNERLMELVASLRSERERLSPVVRGGATPPPLGSGSAPEASAAVDLDRRRLGAELALAREAAAHAAAERDRLRERLTATEMEHQRLCDEYVGLQERSTELAQLFVVLERIHGARTREETLAAIQEIVINVVGSEELAVFERRGEALALAQSFGIDPEPLRTVRVGEGVIGGAAASRRPWIAGREVAASPLEQDLSAAIPLLAHEETVGVIAVFRLLGHKPGFGESDRAVFDLLSGHAGLALRLRAGGARATAG
jgi:hypothetical protein